MNLNEKIEWLEHELEKIKELVLETEQEEKNFPKDGDEFYFIDEHGLVIFATFDADYIENERIKNIGNCFKTLEEADFEVERRKVIKELKEFSSPFVFKRNNYYLFLNLYKYLTPVEIGAVSSTRIDVIYFESEDKAEEAIKAVGEDRIRKYYFGIEE